MTENGQVENFVMHPGPLVSVLVGLLATYLLSPSLAWAQAGGTAAAEIRASVDRDPVRMDESFILTYRFDGPAVEPNFAPLNKTASSSTGKDRALLLRAPWVGRLRRCQFARSALQAIVAGKSRMVTAAMPGSALPRRASIWSEPGREPAV